VKRASEEHEINFPRGRVVHPTGGAAGAGRVVIPLCPEVLFPCPEHEPLWQPPGEAAPDVGGDARDESLGDVAAEGWSAWSWACGSVS
jgi:hypothetical protein